MTAPKMLPQLWDGAIVRQWLDSRVSAAKADQITAERYGRERQDDCDKAAAEEMVCSAIRNEKTTSHQADFLAALAGLAGRDDYIWRGVYNDARFDRHVRAYVKKLVKMAKTKEGFANVSRYQ